MPRRFFSSFNRNQLRPEARYATRLTRVWCVCLRRDGASCSAVAVTLIVQTNLAADTDRTTGGGAERRVA